MEEYKISVIVPVYNAGDYIEDCVNSILQQTYINLEVILVDDGSTDNSLNVCNVLKSKDERVKVIHQDNAGPGAARNRGIDESTGEYIAFVDSDDYIDKEMYKTLTELMQKYQADLVCSSLQDNEDEIRIKVLKREDALYARLKTYEISDSSCDKLYKRNLFSKYRYPCDRFLSEDSALIYKLVSESSLTVTINRKFYNIRNRSKSLSRRNYEPGFRFTILTYEEMVDFFDALDEQQFVAIAQSLASGSVFFNAGEYCKYKCKDKETKKFIKDHARKHLKNHKYLSFKNKTLLKLILIWFEFFGVLYCLKKNKGEKRL